MGVVNVQPAYAGYWSIDPLSYEGDFADYQTQKEKRYSGAIKSEAEGFNSGQTPYPVRAGVQPTVVRTYERNFVNGSDESMDGGALVWRADISATPDAGAGEASSEGSLNLVLRYQPRQNYDDATDSATPDPTDKPTGLLYLKVTVSPSVTARDGNGTQSYNVADKAHVSVSIVPGGDASSVKQDLAEQTIERTKVIHGQKTFYLKFDASDGGGEPGPNGSTLYIVPLVSFKAKATLDRDRQTFRSSWNSTEWNEGRVGANMEVRAEMTQYFLSISSNIEDSWKKLEGDLPQEYQKRVNVNGVWEWQPDSDKAQLVWAHPQIWRVKSRHGADGSMTVESAADYLYDVSAGNILNEQWYGALSPANLTANPQGFSLPDYEWSLQGGQVMPNTSSQLDRHASDLQQLNIAVGDQGTDIDNYAITSGIGLGGTDTLGTKSTTLTATVRETDPSRPAVILNTGYTINWHTPSENDQVIIANDVYIDGTAMTTGTIGNQSNTQEENGSLEVWINPVPWQSIISLNGNDWGFIGGAATVLTSGSALIVERGAQATIGGLSALSKALPSFAVAAGSAGASWTFNGPPVAPLKQNIVNNSAEWGQAVDETLARKAIPPGQQASASDPQIRIDPSSALDGYTESQLKDTNWETNPLWKSYVMTPHIRQNYKNVVTTGDGYDRNGYAGPTRSTSSLPYGSPQLQGHYELQTSNISQF